MQTKWYGRQTYYELSLPYQCMYPAKLEFHQVIIERKEGALLIHDMGAILYEEINLSPRQ
jgi:hypothetical protein